MPFGTVLENTQKRNFSNLKYFWKLIFKISFQECGLDDETIDENDDDIIDEDLLDPPEDPSLLDEIALERKTLENLTLDRNSQIGYHLKVKAYYDRNFYRKYGQSSEFR